MANRKKEKSFVRVTVNLDPDDYANLETLASHSNLSTAWFVRRAIREFIERHGKTEFTDIKVYSGLGGSAHD